MSENLITPEEFEVYKSIYIKLNKRIEEIEEKIKRYLSNSSNDKYGDIKFEIYSKCIVVKFGNDLPYLYIRIKSLDILFSDDMEVNNKLYESYNDSIIEWFNTLNINNLKK